MIRFENIIIAKDDNMNNVSVHRLYNNRDKNKLLIDLLFSIILMESQIISIILSISS